MILKDKPRKNARVFTEKSKKKCLTYSVPLGIPSLVFKLCKLSSIVNSCENLPHQDKSQTDGHNSTYDPQNDTHDVHNHGTFFGFLNPNLKKI